jgi:MFS superfamily sulfate permease-like transporter
VSLSVFAIILGADRINKKIPGALIAVVGMIVISYMLDFPATGTVAVLGTVPSGLPPLGLPQGVITTSNIAALMPTVVAIFVVILAQSAATSRAYAVKYGDSFDENVDLIGLGLANAAAGISGTFVVNGSPTKTEMVDSAGGRTQLAMLTTAGLVIVVLLFLTVPLSYMPNAVLSAVVLLIGLRLIDVRGMRGIYRLRLGEFVVAALTAATVVVVGVEQGIILAIVLSIVEHLYHSYRPYDSLISLSSTGRLRSSPPTEGTQAAAGLAVYFFGASLYYANSARFTSEVLAIVEAADPPLKWFCVSAAAMSDIDYSGAGSIRQVMDELKKRAITLVMTDVDPRVKALLDRYGLTAEIGPAHFYDFVQDAVEAYQQSVATPGAGAAPAGA